MARGLLTLYLLIVLGPVALAAAAFALRDLLARRQPAPSAGNGHSDAEALQYTVEEAPAI